MPRSTTGLILAATLAAGLTSTAAAAPTPAGLNQLISRPTGLGALATPTDGESDLGSRAISGSGRYVLFSSSATDLAGGNLHLIVRDNQTGATAIVDRVGLAGAIGDGYPAAASISEDGSTACFVTSATDLVPGVSGNHLYVKTLATGALTVADRSTGGTLGNNQPQDCSLSADGSSVAFTSYASNLVANDTNNYGDVFVRDLTAQTTSAVDVYNGVLGNAGAQSPSIDASGGRVAFSTRSTDLWGPGGDANNQEDVYVRDLGPAQPQLVSRGVGLGGVQGDGDAEQPSISDDGTRVAFTSTATNLGDGDTDTTADIHVRDITQGTTTLTSRADTGAGVKGDRESRDPAISGDGTAVAFASTATNFGVTSAGDWGDGEPPALVFVRTLATSRTALASSAGAGGTADDGNAGEPSITTNAKRVVWASFAATIDPLADGRFGEVFMRDLPSGAGTLVSRPQGAGGRPGGVADAWAGEQPISADGRFVTFTDRGDMGIAVPRAGEYAYVRDTLTDITTLVSRADGPNGTPVPVDDGAPAISADGTHVAFTSLSKAIGGDGQVDQVYVRDLRNGTTRLVSATPVGKPGKSFAGSPSLDRDGGRIAFDSWSDDLVAGDNNAKIDVFVRDIAGGTTTLVSGPGADGQSHRAAIDATGTRVAYTSDATNLVANDTNGRQDVFVTDLVTGTTVAADVTPGGITAPNGATDSSLSADGNRVAFTASDALAPGGDGKQGEVFVRDIAGHATILASIGTDGQQADKQAFQPALSGDGHSVAFYSAAANLPAGATTWGGLYERNIDTGQITALSLVGGTTTGFTQDASNPRPDFDGGCVLFESRDPQAAAGTYGGTQFSQLYLHTAAGSCPYVAPTPGPGPAPVPPTIQAAPVLSHVSVTHAAFRLATARTATIARAKAKRTPSGTTIRWRLSAVATVKIAIGQRAAGRRSAKRCAVPSRALRHHAACVRVLARVGLVRHARAGNGALAFTGRWGKHRLAPGSYQATLTATDAAGRHSKAVTVRFRVVR